MLERYKGQIEQAINIQPSREVIVEGLLRLPRKERIDVSAGRLCGCPDCKRTAEPILEKNPFLKTLSRKETRRVWEGIKNGK